MQEDIQALELKIHVARYQFVNRQWNTENFSKMFRVIPYSRLYLPIEGEGEVKLNDKVHHLVPGKLLLIPPFTRVNLSCQNKLVKYWAHFNLFHRNTNLDYFSSFSMCLEKEIDELDFYGKIFRMVSSRCFREDQQLSPAEEFEVQSAMRLLLAPFLHFVPDRLSEKDAPRLIELLNYIEKNLDSPLHLAGLAKLSRLNQNYLSNLFKQKMGVPLMHYIGKRRISQAAEYIVSSAFSMGEIAEKVGIENLVVFSKKFKSEYGMSPLQYRKENKPLTPKITPFVAGNSASHDDA